MDRDVIMSPSNAGSPIATGVRVARTRSWRLRVRTLLVLVALIAFGIEGTRIVGRWASCRQRAGIMARWTSYREATAHCDETARNTAEIAAGSKTLQGRTSAGRQEQVYREMAEDLRAFTHWCESVRDLYEAGEARPWRPIPPEPPRPASKLAAILSSGW